MTGSLKALNRAGVAFLFWLLGATDGALNEHLSKEISGQHRANPAPS
jgi:hypothetical protein